MKPLIADTAIKVADQVWIAVALLHREHPERGDFTVEEIVDRAKRETRNIPFRPGVYVHVVQHCVANDARLQRKQVDGIQFIVPLERVPI